MYRPQDHFRPVCEDSYMLAGSIIAISERQRREGSGLLRGR